ncbi:MAG: hypothetical protein IJU44_06455 [Kiritimatiellae bacterium]|nr:hypothetical protein [Kiritimatiellia bacterium]
MNKLIMFVVITAVALGMAGCYDDTSAESIGIIGGDEDGPTAIWMTTQGEP